ncbi:MAG: type I restriction enzyme HsdR N-terminal domain-containing protein [Cytophagales bacterium]|nr:type I restriction enzyme HsdR N-terminal domain-containing protein [Cytophagales bacterium]
MEPINFPAFECKVKDEAGKRYIFDSIRKKYLVLTPEEWVRQHIVNFLINHRNYPKSLIKLESGTVYNQVKGRSDIIVFTREGTPFLLIECKSPDVKLLQRDIEQLGVYNLKYQAPYMMLSNGLQNFIYKIDLEAKLYKAIQDIPEFY